MMNYIWMFLIATAVITAGCHDILDPASHKMQDLTSSAVTSAESAVKISIGLIGIMALWLGIAKIAEEAGLINILSKLVQPVIHKLFPEIPKNHPAIGAMVMNISANMLGLNNAATPLGIKAMEDLQTLNEEKETATNAMCTFLAINTSSVQIIPTTTIGILAASGSVNPTSIVGSTIIATTIALVVAITAVKLLEKLPIFKIKRT